MEAQNLAGITPRTGTSHGACGWFSPLLPRGPRWTEWSKARGLSSSVPSPIPKDVSGQLPSHLGLLAGLQDPVHDVLWEVSPGWPVAGPSWGPPSQATLLPGQEAQERASSSLWAGGEAACLGSPPVPRGQSAGAAACGHPAHPARRPLFLWLLSLWGPPAHIFPGPSFRQAQVPVLLPKPSGCL